ncbi:unnamed protein product [Lepeophtheirus salmonis]|uniref:(salmon louse) hypothetical protein n=1 Tax=Lepeophtheirus salmonis TaxID=72036 RepID=A0A7R8D5N1_LEPSM|nr:unnamed protein product [Lepeophtheirus salmonis]CAF3037146.1 unnamed protein product [Lepeophtheirus salmonis]
MHPGYKTTPRGVINDLAIVTIKNEFEFESTIQPICLPLLKSSIPRIGSSIIASGWGLTNYTHTKSPPALLRTNLQVYSFDIRVAYEEYYLMHQRIQSCAFIIPHLVHAMVIQGVH